MEIYRRLITLEQYPDIKVNDFAGVYNRKVFLEEFVYKFLPRRLISLNVKRIVQIPNEHYEYFRKCVYKLMNYLLTLAARLKAKKNNEK